jgi:hypothetical protein
MLGYNIFSNVFLEPFLSLCQTRKIWLPCFNFLSQQELPFQFNFFCVACARNLLDTLFFLLALNA